MSDVDVLIGGMLISFLKSGSSSMHWFLYVLSSSGMGVRGGAQFPPCHHSWDIRMFKRQHWHNGCGKGHGECGWGGEEEDGRFCVEPGREEAMLKGQKLFFRW